MSQVARNAVSSVQIIPLRPKEVGNHRSIKLPVVSNGPVSSPAQNPHQTATFWKSLDALGSHVN